MVSGFPKTWLDEKDLLLFGTILFGHDRILHCGGKHLIDNGSEVIIEHHVLVQNVPFVVESPLPYLVEL